MHVTNAQRIRVSSEFISLRKAFKTLNLTLWSTELAYGYVLSDPARDFSNPNRLTREALSGVTNSQVWYPNRSGQIRYTERVSEFLDRIKQNTSFTYRGVIVFAFASFDEYLVTRVKKGATRGWGPYVVSLSSLIREGSSLDLPALLSADFCRLLRNQIAHAPSADLRADIDPDLTSAWRQELAKLNRPLADRLTDEVIDAAKRHVFDEAAGCVRQAARHGQTLPVELFYMLFTLSNLDKLAVAIEGSMPATENMKQIVLKPRRSSAGKPALERSDAVSSANSKSA